jgi:23S rRNA pseudouridine1911/1915/1917 synthase
MKACELYQIPPELAGQRLDQILVRLLPDHSRSRLQEWVRTGRVTVDGAQTAPSVRLRGGEQVAVTPAEAPAEGGPVAEAIAIDIVHEDAELLVVNKPAGLVVHPGAGNPAGTLMNALLHHDPALAQVPRAGIVHRLDKDTTGLLLVARTLPAHKQLVDQLAERAIHREYLALVQGLLIAGGTVDEPIGRHRSDRTRMAVTAGGRITASRSAFAATPCCGSCWRPVARTRFAYIWRASAMRWSVIPPTGVCACRRGRVRNWSRRWVPSGARRCMPGGWR